MHPPVGRGGSNNGPLSPCGYPFGREPPRSYYQHRHAGPIICPRCLCSCDWQFHATRRGDGGGLLPPIRSYPSRGITRDDIAGLCVPRMCAGHEEWWKSRYGPHLQDRIYRTKSKTRCQKWKWYLQNKLTENRVQNTEKEKNKENTWICGSEIIVKTNLIHTGNRKEKRKGNCNGQNNLKEYVRLHKSIKSSFMGLSNFNLPISIISKSTI